MPLGHCHPESRSRVDRTECKISTFLVGNCNNVRQGKSGNEEDGSLLFTLGNTDNTEIPGYCRCNSRVKPLVGMATLKRAIK